MRREIGIAIGAAAAAAALAGVAYRFLRGRTAEPLALPPASAPSTPASDEPLARETRFDEHLDEEEARRHEAAERLKADPLSEQVDNGA